MEEEKRTKQRMQDHSKHNRRGKGNEHETITKKVRELRRKIRLKGKDSGSGVLSSIGYFFSLLSLCCILITSRVEPSTVKRNFEHRTRGRALDGFRFYNSLDRATSWLPQVHCINWGCWSWKLEAGSWKLELVESKTQIRRFVHC